MNKIESMKKSELMVEARARGLTEKLRTIDADLRKITKEELITVISSDIARKEHQVQKQKQKNGRRLEQSYRFLYVYSEMQRRMQKNPQMKIRIRHLKI
jgi:hypothetical protein